jgi:hypothetical protein
MKLHLSASALSYLSSSCVFFNPVSMNTRSWKILSWNVRGINSDKKWNSIRDCIVESGCDIVCLQETKRAVFDLSFVRFFCPPSFDRFEFLPSVGASGGSIILWKSNFFKATWCFKTIMQHLSSSPLIIVVPPGF